MRFWNHIAHVFRNTRAALAALGLLAILGYFLIQPHLQPTITQQTTLTVPVLAIERDPPDNPWMILQIATEEEGLLRVRWLDVGFPLSVGTPVQLRITDYADGQREYRVYLARLWPI